MLEHFSRNFSLPIPTLTFSIRRATVRLALASLLFIASPALLASRAGAKSKRRVPAGGRAAVVVDERLSALREEPALAGALARRLGRGRVVALTGARRAADGVVFYQVAVTRRTRGWLQSECFVAPARAGDDARLLSLITSSKGFDRVERARVFLDLFPRSGLRPQVLLLYGEAAEESASQLSRAASNRLAEDRLPADAAPLRSYYLNFNGLDRFRRQGVAFTFDESARRFHYDGAAWREIVRRHPHSPEAAEARRRLDALASRGARK
ncbi:MAG: hypothetical protein LC746_02175 [Acidobacteria bacterium]|nr:hypothetical protein [Acidobacteriota bacterium]